MQIFTIFSADNAQLVCLSIEKNDSISAVFTVHGKESQAPGVDFKQFLLFE